MEPEGRSPPTIQVPNPPLNPTEPDHDYTRRTKDVIFAAAHHDTPRLRAILVASAEDPRALASRPDPDSGRTPLHAVVASLAAETRDGAATPNGDAAESSEREGEDEEGRAVRAAELLLQNGAVWNALDAEDETPGCLAWRLGKERVYEVFVEAGVRAELLFGRLDGYEALADGSSSEGDVQVELEEEEAKSKEDEDEPDKPHDAPTAPAANPSDSTPTAPHVLAEEQEPLDNQTFLSSSLSFLPDRILDTRGNAVMMTWETALMRRTAALLLPSPGLRVLNIGFGLGVIDTAFRSHAPSAHHIVEAHPGVLRSMAEPGGWLARQRAISSSSGGDGSEIEVHEGRWQDVLPRLIEGDETFDAVFFDTFAEGYAEFRGFMEELVIGLLRPRGRWSFFMGMGADRRVCYDVYTRVVECDAEGAGWDVEWERVALPEMGAVGGGDAERRRGGEDGEGGGDVWRGVRRKYWSVDEYRLPICTFIG